MKKITAPFVRKVLDLDRKMTSKDQVKLGRKLKGETYRTHKSCRVEDHIIYALLKKFGTFQAAIDYLIEKEYKSILKKQVDKMLKDDYEAISKGSGK